MGTLGWGCAGGRAWGLAVPPTLCTGPISCHKDPRGVPPSFCLPQTRQLSTPPAHSPLSIPQFNRCLPPSHLPLPKSKSPEITHSLNNSSSFNKHLSANTWGDGGGLRWIGGGEEVGRPMGRERVGSGKGGQLRPLPISGGPLLSPSTGLLFWVIRDEGLGLHDPGEWERGVPSFKCLSS